MAAFTVLAAFCIEADSMREAQEQLMSQLPNCKDYPGVAGIDSWWIAMDERYDRSDNDSAVFVPYERVPYWQRRKLVCLDSTGDVMSLLRLVNHEIERLEARDGHVGIAWELELSALEKVRRLLRGTIEKELPPCAK